MSGSNGTIGVIGGGIFGCATALGLADAGLRVTLFERLPEILCGTSRNNTNRVHMGYHYPRDVQTAIRSRDSYRRFVAKFGDAILADFPNVYCIASEGSLTSADDYLRFCDHIKLPHSTLDLKRHRTEIKQCDLALRCEEAVCDADILRQLLRGRLCQHPNIAVQCGTEVAAIDQDTRFELRTSAAVGKLGFDAVVNCSYADINRLTNHLGHKVAEQQFEYTVVPIIDVDLPPQGITVMDGPFVTLLPYGKTGHFSLYHVVHSVIRTEIQSIVSQDWLDSKNSPFSSMDREAYFRKFLEACADFIPALQKATLRGFLEGPRMVLANHEKDDARPSIVQNYGQGYLTVYAGKIDHCLSIADSVCQLVCQHFAEM